MSNQDPPFGNNPERSTTASSTSFGDAARDAGINPSAEADRLRDAGDTLRSDLSQAADQAKNDFRNAADTARQDFAALKSQAGDQLQSLKAQATDEFSNLKAQAQDQLGDAAEKAKAFAGEQVSQLTDRARSFATEQKDLAARQIGGVVDAVSRVAEELQDGDSAVAGYAQDMAGSLRRLADSVQNKSVDDLVGVAQDFGRRQPLAFVGIAALAGFAASRFLLASAKRPTRTASVGDFDDNDFDADFNRGTGQNDDLTPIGMTNNGRL